jgi:hypothetical protein
MASPNYQVTFSGGLWREPQQNSCVVVEWSMCSWWVGGCVLWDLSVDDLFAVEIDLHSLYTPPAHIFFFIHTPCDMITYGAVSEVWISAYCQTGSKLAHSSIPVFYKGFCTCASVQELFVYIVWVAKMFKHPTFAVQEQDLSLFSRFKYFIRVFFCAQVTVSNNNLTHGLPSYPGGGWR